MSANAAWYWQNITGNGTDIASQLSMEVGGSGSALTLTFKNNVGIASSITDIYIDAPPPGGGTSPSPYFTSGPTFTSSAGVNFTVGAAPPDLPGGGAFNFVASSSADSSAPPPQNGVNSASEWLTLSFVLAAPTTVDDVIAALNSGQFRVGLHIQALPGGKSDSYMTVVPEPSTYIAGGLALLPLLFGLRSRFGKKA